MTQTPYYPSQPYNAASSAYYAGQQVGQTAGGLVTGIAAPVVGFSQGLLQGRGMILALIVLGAIIINARQQ